MSAQSVCHIIELAELQCRINPGFLMAEFYRVSLFVAVIVL